METKMKAGMAAAVLLAALTVGAAPAPTAPKPDMTVRFDLKMPTLRDLSESSAFPTLGYAGCIADEGDRYFDEFFVKSPDRTWEAFKGAGARLVKEWGADGHWDENDPEHRWAKITYSWRKKHGVKVLLCIENGGRTINDARRRILGFVQWIVDNGFKDQVAGFELGNEPYWGSAPEQFAARWAAIVPDIKKIWPEAQIGFAIAEYRAGDPDIESVRKRLSTVDEWFNFGGGEWGMSKLNQWSGRFINAFSNCLQHCSHVVYHFYGGFGPYGCTYNGIQRVRNFARAFPEVKDKKVWITEWRYTADDDLRYQQSFSFAMFDALYMMMCICQPEIDGLSAHQCGWLSGGFYIADGRGDWCQRRERETDRMFVDPDWTGRPRLEVGPVGPVFKLLNEAILTHPHVLARGRRHEGTISDDNYWSSRCYVDSSSKIGGWIQGGGDLAMRPPDGGVLEWILLANEERTSVSLVVANAGIQTWKPPFETIGCTVGKSKVRLYRCRPEHEILHQVPGEPRLSWEEECEGEAGRIEVPGLSVATLTFPVSKGGAR